MKNTSPAATPGNFIRIAVNNGETVVARHAVFEANIGGQTWRLGMLSNGNLVARSGNVEKTVHLQGDHGRQLTVTMGGNEQVFRFMKDKSPVVVEMGGQDYEVNLSGTDYVRLKNGNTPVYYHKPDNQWREVPFPRENSHLGRGLLENLPDELLKTAPGDRVLSEYGTVDQQLFRSGANNGDVYLRIQKPKGTEGVTRTQVDVYYVRVRPEGDKIRFLPEKGKEGAVADQSAARWTGWQWEFTRSPFSPLRKLRSADLRSKDASLDQRSSVTKEKTPQGPDIVKISENKLEDGLFSNRALNSLFKKTSEYIESKILQEGNQDIPPHQNKILSSVEHKRDQLNTDDYFLRFIDNILTSCNSENNCSIKNKFVNDFKNKLQNDGVDFNRFDEILYGTLVYTPNQGTHFLCEFIGVSPSEENQKKAFLAYKAMIFHGIYNIKPINIFSQINTGIKVFMDYIWTFPSVNDEFVFELKELLIKGMDNTPLTPQRKELFADVISKDVLSIDKFRIISEILKKTIYTNTPDGWSLFYLANHLHANNITLGTITNAITSIKEEIDPKDSNYNETIKKITQYPFNFNVSLFLSLQRGTQKRSLNDGAKLYIETLHKNTIRGGEVVAVVNEIRNGTYNSFLSALDLTPAKIKDAKEKKIRIYKETIELPDLFVTKMRIKCLHATKAVYSWLLNNVCPETPYSLSLLRIRNERGNTYPGVVLKFTFQSNYTMLVYLNHDITGGFLGSEDKAKNNLLLYIKEKRHSIINTQKEFTNDSGIFFEDIKDLAPNEVEKNSIFIVDNVLMKTVTLRDWFNSKDVTVSIGYKTFGDIVSLQFIIPFYSCVTALIDVVNESVHDGSIDADYINHQKIYLSISCAESGYVLNALYESIRKVSKSIRGLVKMRSMSVNQAFRQMALTPGSISIINESEGTAFYIATAEHSVISPNSEEVEFVDESIYLNALEFSEIDSNMNQRVVVWQAHPERVLPPGLFGGLTEESESFSMIEDDFGNFIEKTIPSPSRTPISDIELSVDMEITEADGIHNANLRVTIDGDPSPTELSIYRRQLIDNIYSIMDLLTLNSASLGGRLLQSIITGARLGLYVKAFKVFVTLFGLAVAIAIVKRIILHLMDPNIKLGEMSFTLSQDDMHANNATNAEGFKFTISENEYSYSTLLSVTADKKNNSLSNEDSEYITDTPLSEQLGNTTVASINKAQEHFFAGDMADTHLIKSVLKRFGDMIGEIIKLKEKYDEIKELLNIEMRKTSFNISDKTSRLLSYLERHDAIYELEILLEHLSEERNDVWIYRLKRKSGSILELVTEFEIKLAKINSESESEINKLIKYREIKFPYKSLYFFSFEHIISLLSRDEDILNEIMNEITSVFDVNNIIVYLKEYQAFNGLDYLVVGKNASLASNEIFQLIDGAVEVNSTPFFKEKRAALLFHFAILLNAQEKINDFSAKALLFSKVDGYVDIQGVGAWIG